MKRKPRLDGDSAVIRKVPSITTLLNTTAMNTKNHSVQRTILKKLSSSILLTANPTHGLKSTLDPLFSMSTLPIWPTPPYIHLGIDKLVQLFKKQLVGLGGSVSVKLDNFCTHLSLETVFPVLKLTQSCYKYELFFLAN